MRNRSVYCVLSYAKNEFFVRELLTRLSYSNIYIFYKLFTIRTFIDDFFHSISDKLRLNKKNRFGNIAQRLLRSVKSVCNNCPFKFKVTHSAHCATDTFELQMAADPFDIPEMLMHLHTCILTLTLFSFQSCYFRKTIVTSFLKEFETGKKSRNSQLEFVDCDQYEVVHSTNFHIIGIYDRRSAYFYTTSS